MIEGLDAYKLATPPNMFNEDVVYQDCYHCTEPTNVKDLVVYDTDEVCANCYKIAKYYELLEKADIKLKKIINSECLIYKLAGGELQKHQDILFAEKVLNRIYNRIKELSK